MSVVVVDTAVANVGSVANMLHRIGVTPEVSSDPDVVARASRLILPGVGSFDVGMQHLRRSGTAEALDDAVRGRGVPILGLCLGMQLLADASDEGTSTGLGWIPGRVRRLAPVVDGEPRRVPHMGWNTVRGIGPSPLAALAAEEGRRFYFVHSFAYEPVDPAATIGITDYGAPFTSVVEQGHVAGVQFHPEKSHRHGMALLAGWLGV